jgi:GDP-D-mannose 3',5'-epimerase
MTAAREKGPTMNESRPKRIEDVRKTDDLIVVTGAGGFIAGSLVRYFRDKGFRRIRAVDKKPLDEWYRRTPGVEDLVLDVSFRDNCAKACDGAVEVYNLAADMGGAPSSSTPT